MPTAPIVPFSGIIQQTPDPFQPIYVVQMARNNARGRFELSVSKDTGATFNVILPQPGQKTQAGSVLTLLSTGDVDWKPPVYPQADGPTVFAEMTCAGILANNAIFGYFSAPPNVSMKCLGVQVSLQGAATGSPVILDFVNLAGTPQGYQTSVPVSTEYVQNYFSNPLLMPATSAWRVKVLQAGSDVPGEFATVRLVLQPD